MPSAEESSPVWSALGLPADVLDKVAAEWRLLWSGGRLQLASSCCENPHILEELSDIFVATVSIQKYTESRWLTVGRSCRSLSLSLLMGLDSLVEHTLAKQTGDCPLKGFRQLAADDNREFTVVCGMASYVADSVLELLLEDPRAGLQLDTWILAAQEYLSWLSEWEPAWWACLARRALGDQGNGRQLQDKVLQAAFVSMAFMQQEIFVPASQPPWRLGRGDIEDNLKKLGEGPAATESTTWKIQKLVIMGSNMQELVAGVRLLMEASWATSVTEQQHASVQLVQRRHPAYFLPLLLMRAGLHSLRRLLPSGDQDRRLVRSGSCRSSLPGPLPRTLRKSEAECCSSSRRAMPSVTGL